MRARNLAILALIAAPAFAQSPDATGPKPNDATLGARPPEKAVVLFDGKSLDGWVKTDGKTPAAWPVEDGIMTVGAKQGAIMTSRTLGDVRLHLEFNVPYMPEARGQARGNSGVYLAG